MAAADRPLVGIDFDNTIVCYDSVFHRLAFDAGLIPADLPVDKTSVRDHLRSIGREDRWTTLQGIVYGERMPEARPFPGVLEFFSACADRSAPIRIISHRTRQPIVGAPCDLHTAARRWLEENGFLEFVKSETIWFEETRKNKVARVCSEGCTDFIDDLPEMLAEPHLPSDMRRILFDPAGIARAQAGVTAVSSWAEIRRLFRL